MIFLSEKNRELSELAQKHGYSEDVQRLIAAQNIIDAASVKYDIENNASEKDLVICVFLSCYLNEYVLFTDDPEKELKEYHDNEYKEALSKYKKHSRDGKFVFTFTLPIN